ncbi:MAG: class II fructose-bisphosphate aldolase [Eubacteriaceae bacterium]|jgi:fructose-bisphosphate aldolase class II|nr:class II fructose-bisphosphate aldolase [Eubacteriaceae bacterium]
MLVNLRDIIQDAYKNKYALGSFNGYNFETFKGTVDAGVEKNVPVIVAFGAKYLTNMSLKTAHAMVQSIAEEVNIPVCLHLDHCSDMDIIFEAIDIGFGSVMYDGSMLPFEENLANTKKVCEKAHAKGVSVEAELGSLAAGAESHEGSADDKEVYTDPDKAKEFVEETKVDCLAVSIGTVHGLYKGTPEIRIDILKEINEKCQIPLVLHGGSGTPEDVLKASIENGIAKINVNTEISKQVVEDTLKSLSEKTVHYSVLSLEQRDSVKKVVEKYIDIYKN